MNMMIGYKGEDMDGSRFQHTTIIFLKAKESLREFLSLFRKGEDELEL